MLEVAVVQFAQVKLVLHYACVSVTNNHDKDIHVSSSCHNLRK